MALNEDVRLTVSVDVTGDERVKALADGVAGVGEKSQSAAPQLGQLREEVERVGQQSAAAGVFDKIQQNIGKLALAVAGYFAGKGISGAITSSVDAAEKLDIQMRTLEQVIQATGGAAGFTAAELDAMARRLDEATLGSAAGFRDAAAALMTFKSVGRDSFETVLMLAADLEATGFGNLQNNIVQLGKAMEDPVKGLTALAKSGVTFSDSQKAVIESLVATGRAAEAQAVVLGAIESQVKGVATAAGGGMAGAIDLVGKRLTDLKEQLGAAVLPALTDFNLKIAEVYGRLSESGVVVRFGEVVASAFRASTDAFVRFVDSIDLDAITAKLSSWASSTKETFDQVAANLSTASNVFKTAFGVMSAGFNLLVGAAYKVGEGVSYMTSMVLADLAKIMGGLDRITPDIITDRFSKAAASLREESAAAAAVMVAFGEKAQGAFASAAEGAETAREGWSDLTAPIAAAGNAAEAAGKKLGEAATQAGLSADQLDALGEGAEYAAGELLRAGAGAEQIAEATGKVGPAAAEAAAKIAELRAEYQRLIEVGDTQGAAKVLVQIQAELDKTRAKATATADEVEEAFKRLGVASSASLKAAAEAARADFDLIRAAGIASAADIRAAFTAYAEAAVKANGGVVDALLQQQAGQVGLRLEADKTGKLMVKTFAEVAAAAVKVEESAKDAATGISELGQAAAGASAAAGSLAANWDEAGNIVGETAGIATRSAGQITEAFDETQQAMASSVGAMRGMNVQAERWAKDLGAALQAPFEKARALENALSRISAQQDRLTSSAARGVDDLKLRLIELNGTEDEIAKARLERDKADVARQIRLIELEIKRAAVRGESGEAQRLREEIRLLEEQLVLIDKVFKAEQRNASERSRGGSSGDGGSSSGGSVTKGGASGGSTSSEPPRPRTTTITNNPVFHINGITDPAKLAPMLDKELRKLNALRG